MQDQQRQQLHKLCSQVTWNADMAAYSTFRSGHRVEAMVEVRGENELVALLPWLCKQGIPWQVIGGGSNILVATRDYQGVFIRQRGQVRDSVQVGQDGETILIRVPAGCSLAALVGWCSSNSLAGLSFMAGIPGSVGGALQMNAGAFGRAIGELVESLRCVHSSGEVVEIPHDRVQFSYRSTLIPGSSDAGVMISSVVLRLERGESQTIRNHCREIIAKRKQKQPQGVASAGSFFKNPAGDFAGRLIEKAGLKGVCLGKAMVSPKHANFIVNIGGAQPEDIIGLMEKVRKTVFQQCGVLLEPEVRIF
nr:UDP-N-acetylmuramate dehydrogenase [uncultured Desulfobulbus sp.]